MSQPDKFTMALEDFDVLIERTKALMRQCVKKIHVWDFPEYDALSRSIKKSEAIREELAAMQEKGGRSEFAKAYEEGRLKVRNDLTGEWDTVDLDYWKKRCLDAESRIASLTAQKYWAEETLKSMQQAQAADVEALKMNYDDGEYRSGWNNCIDHLSETGRLK